MQIYLEGSHGPIQSYWLYAYEKIHVVEAKVQSMNVVELKKQSMQLSELGWDLASMYSFYISIEVAASWTNVWNYNNFFGN